MTSTMLNEPPIDIQFGGTASLLPAFLVHLSNESLDLKPNTEYDPLNPLSPQNLFETRNEHDLPLSLELSKSEAEPILVERLTTGSTVVAVDVSSIRIGDTSLGSLCALRGAVVWRKSGEYGYARCGPLIFHLTDATIHSIFQRLGVSSTLTAPDVPLANRVLGRLRNALERWIQNSMCGSFKDSLILLDGSLTAGTPDNPVRPVASMLNTARSNQDTVLAISKSTKLRLMGNGITQLTEHINSACLIDVDSAVRRSFPPYPMQMLGRIFVAKLLQNGFSFRLDVDRGVGRDLAIESVRKLMGADIISQGYPETLRLAHILSTFTANEVIGIQRFLRGRHGLRAEPSFNLRRSLFGPYGSSWEAS